MSDWAAFWLCLAVVYAVDSWLFSKGYETWFHTHRTDEEKELQRKIIESRHDAASCTTSEGK